MLEINPIDSMMVASSTYVEMTAQHMAAISDVTRRQLEEYDISVRDVSSEEDAQKKIDEKKQTDKVKAQQNAETYYDKQIVSDALHLAEDIGLSVMYGTDILILMDNIKSRLTELKNTVGDNKNLNKVVEEYSNRYDYIYAQYMNKKDYLNNQVIMSLDAMSVSSLATKTSV